MMTYIWLLENKLYTLKVVLTILFI